MKTVRTGTLSLICLAVLIVSGLAGCGVRGSLESPSKATGEAKPAASGTATTDAPKPHRPFVLDGILR